MSTQSGALRCLGGLGRKPGSAGENRNIKELRENCSYLNSSNVEVCLMAQSHWGSYCDYVHEPFDSRDALFAAIRS